MPLLGLCPFGDDMRATLPTPREMWGIQPICALMGRVLHINTMMSKESSAPFGGGVRIFGGVDHPADSGPQNSF